MYSITTFNSVPAKAPAFFVSCDDLLCCLLVSARVLCDQPSCHNCSQLAIIVNIFSFNC
jgi:hypothetical protein